jgi:CubicO group peptidase (beta-lactamase class C family)
LSLTTERPLDTGATLVQKVTLPTPAEADQPFSSLQEWFIARMTELNIPGAVLGVIYQDVIERVGLGVANLTTQAPVTTSTAFRVASLTKILTATGIMQLIGEHDATLDDPIATWYPAFRVADHEATTSATMRHLLSHSGGWADAPWPDGDISALTLADVAGDNASAPQLATPGALFNYSNSSFLLAGHILAMAAGTSYEDAITSRVLQPLGMDRSGFSQVDFEGFTIAAGHTEGETGLEPNDPWSIAPAFNPAGGLLSTVDDLLRFVAFFADNAQQETLPLTTDQRRSMLQPQGPGGSLGPIAADAIGLGWTLTQAGEHQVAMSFGSDSGAAAGMAVVAGQRFGVVILANSDPGLQLATETVGKAMECYFQASLPAVRRVDLTPADLAATVGTFAIPGDLSFELRLEGTDVYMTSRAGSEIVPPLTGPVDMLSPTLGRMQVGTMPILIDFIHDATGRITAIRQFARLAPRVS